MSHLSPQRLQPCFCLRLELRLFLQFRIHLGRLAIYQLDQRRFVGLAEGYVVAAVLGELGTALAVGVAAFGTAVGAYAHHGGFLAAFGGLWHYVVPLVFGGEGFVEGFGRFVELDYFEEFGADLGIYALIFTVVK
jgi:hypothetical protein